MEYPKEMKTGEDRRKRLNGQRTEQKQITKNRNRGGFWRSEKLSYSGGWLPLAPVATRLALFTSDFSSTPWLCHVYTPFVAWKLNYPASPSPSSPARHLLIPVTSVKPLRFYSEVAQC
ncbi:MAG: hypothetical protein ABSB33_03695, partial [Tepidisphaeraceae bacterium]